MLVSIVEGVSGQGEETRWIIDAETSLAWYQIEPHYSHLWATTCPDEPSWQSGEGRSVGTENVDYTTRPTIYGANVADSRIPMFPRGDVSPVCRRAVEGRVTIGDTVSWTGVVGLVTALPDSLITGLNMRDKFMRYKLLKTHLYKEMSFRLDSLTAVQPGDTLFATAVGEFEMMEVRRPVEAAVAAWHEAGGIRVLAQWQMDAHIRHCLSKEPI